MQKNTKTVVASVLCLFVVLMGALLWRASSQFNGDQVPNAAVLIQTGQLPTPNPRAQGLGVAATDDMTNGNYIQAIEKYRQSLVIQPNPDIQIGLAMALLRVGKRTEATQLVRDVAQGQSHAKQTAATILAKIENDPNWGADKKP